MLMGEYHNNLDLKGRVVIPSKLRESLGLVVVLTRGLDNSLFLFSKEEWNLLTEKLKDLSFTDKETRNFLRFFYSSAITLELDKQGRILIPNYLKEFANLTKEIVLIGVLNRVEIWSIDSWNNFIAKNFDSLSQISDSLFSN